MHEVVSLVKDLAVILGVASIVILLFQKIRQPVVLGYLVAGIIISPKTTSYSLLEDLPSIQTLSTFGVIFLMFSLGLEFSFHKLKRVGFSASVTGFLEVALMSLLGFGTGILLDWSFYDSIFLGAALSISSTTIIIKALEELNLKTKRFAELVFGILIVEDLLAILILVGLSTVVATHNFFSMTLFWAFVKLILVVGGWFLTGYFLVPSLFRRIEDYINEETLTVVSIALCLFLVSVADYFSYSAALGAFIMGSVLAETPLVHRIETLIKPIRDIFAAIFFVSIGMMIDPVLLISHGYLIFVICVITIIGKILTAGIGAFLTGQSPDSALRIGFSMAQIGEFSFIIAGLGMSLGVISHNVFPVIIGISAITTFTTPYFIRFSIYAGRQLEKRTSEKTKYFLKSYSNWVYRVLSSSDKKRSYLKHIFRFCLNALTVAIVFVGTQQWIYSFFLRFMHSLAMAKVLGWLSAMILSATFIWGMLKTFEESPGRYIGAFLTALEVTLLSIVYFSSWWLAIGLFLIAIILFRLLNKHLDTSYQWFEKQLIRNVANNKSKEPNKLYEELAPWDSRLVELDVPAQSELIGKTLAQLQLRQSLGINIIGIQREGEVIVNPGKDHLLFPSDKIIVLGSDKQIEAFSQRYIKVASSSKKSDPDRLSQFALRTLLLEEPHPLIGKSIKDSGLPKQVNGLVVGIERKGLRLFNPDSSTLLENGDLLFIMSEKAYS